MQGLGWRALRRRGVGLRTSTFLSTFVGRIVFAVRWGQLSDEELREKFCQLDTDKSGKLCRLGSQ